jgi:hypothetical protein
VSRITTPLARKKIVSLIFEKERLIGAVRETQNFKTKHYILFYRRNMAGILLKRRKTKINQSINLETFVSENLSRTNLR